MAHVNHHDHLTADGLPLRTAASSAILLNRIWPGLLMLSSMLASFAFTCATPFAAYGAVTSRTLPLRSALLAITGIWVLNQAIGYGLLGYPTDTTTLLWGAALLIAPLAATAAAFGTQRFVASQHGLVKSGVALVVAFGIYELLLVAATPVLGGAEAFSWDIVRDIALTNLYWAVGLLVAYEIVRRIADKLGR